MFDVVIVWDLEKKKVLYTLRHPTLVKTVSLGSLGHLLVTAGSDYLLRLYDLRRLENEDEGSIEYSRDYFVTPSPFVEKPNTRYTVMESFADNITVWDTVTGAKVECWSVKLF